jgi:hypothetical protein
MAERMSHEEYVASARAEIVALAREMPTVDVSFLDGAVRLCQLRREAEIPDADPDFDTLTIISSETDALPEGEVRSMWSREALAKLEHEIDDSELWAKEIASHACQSIIERFDA